MGLSPTQIATRHKSRPNTEAGRRRPRPGLEDPSTTAVTDPNAEVNAMSGASDHGRSDNSERPSKKFVSTP